MTYKHCSAIAMALALLPLGAGVARAQPSDTGTTATDAAQTAGLQEVVVTAERREESAQRAAIAISTVNGDAIADAGVTKAAGLTVLVPALQVADATGPYDVFFLRGIGNFAGTGLTDPAIAMNFDGVTVTRSGTAGMFYDLQRVEVLKGPQGTLYGRNATGGVINVISKAPVLNAFGIDASVEYGNYSAFRADGMLNLPINDIMGVRVAAFHVQHNGYMNDGSGDQQDSGGRVSWLFKPIDSLDISLVGDYYHQGGKEISQTTVIGVNSPAFGFVAPAAAPSFTPDQRVGMFSPEMAAYLQTQPNPLSGRDFVPFAPISHENNTYWGVQSTINWTNPLGTLTVIPSYRRSKNNYTSLSSGVMLRELQTERETSVEARLTSPTDQALRYIAGVYYLDDPVHEPNFNVNQQAVFTSQHYDVGTVSKAAFATLSYAIMPTTRVTGGIRYTRDDKDFTGTSSANSVICKVPNGPFPTLCPNAPVLNYSLLTPLPPNFNPFAPGANGTITTASTFPNGPEGSSYSKVTWRGALEQDLTDQNMLYLSAETGYRSGGFSFSGDTATQTFKPETIRAYTLGSKNRFLDNKLQINVEAFYYKYHDQQIASLQFDSQGHLIFPTLNVGTATYKGAELEIGARVLPNTLLNGDVQYESGRYDSFNYSTPDQNFNHGSQTGCPSSLTPNPLYVPNGAQPQYFYSINCSGFGPPMTPHWTLASGVQQTIPLPGGKLLAQAQGHYQSAAATGRYFLPSEIQGGYALWDVDFTYTTTGDRFFVGAYVHNAFDKIANSYSFAIPLSAVESAILLPPRTYGARIGMHY